MIYLLAFASGCLPADASRGRVRAEAPAPAPAGWTSQWTEMVVVDFTDAATADIGVTNGSKTIDGYTAKLNNSGDFLDTTASTGFHLVNGEGLIMQTDAADSSLADWDPTTLSAHVEFQLDDLMDTDTYPAANVDIREQYRELAIAFWFDVTDADSADQVFHCGIYGNGTTAGSHGHSCGAGHNGTTNVVEHNKQQSVFASNAYTEAQIGVTGVDHVVLKTNHAEATCYYGAAATVSTLATTYKSESDMHAIVAMTSGFPHSTTGNDDDYAIHHNSWVGCGPTDTAAAGVRFVLKGFSVYGLGHLPIADETEDWQVN